MRVTPAHALLFATVMSIVAILTQMAFAGGSNTLTVVAIRNVVGTTILAGFLAASRLPMRLPPRQRAIALGIGLVLGLNNLFINMAIEMMPVPVAILSFYTYPVWTAIWAWLRRTEPFRIGSAFGVLLAFAGLGLTLGVAPEAPNLLGVVFGLLAAISWSAVMALSAAYLPDTNTHARTMYMLVSASLAFVVLLLASGSFALPEGTKGIAALAGLPFVYALGMVGMLWVTQGLGPMRASFFMNIEPVSTLTLAAVFLGQSLTGLQLVGAALVIVSLVVFRPPPAATADDGPG